VTISCLVIGTGGREHALARALSLDPGVSAVHCAPGNPGIAAVATLHDVDPLSGAAVADLAVSLGVDLVVVGPEAPLVAGVADAVRERGIAVFGPSGAAARLEGSKAFAKEVMEAAGVPTAAAMVCTTPGEVQAALDAYGPPYVVKDDGLAAGKGVVVTSDRDAAVEHAAQCERVVIEEFLDGPEVSLFAITDGTTVYPLQPAQDFKRIHDGDEGPNTGGMGAYTPLPWAPEGLVDEVLRDVLQPTVDEMARRGTPFSGLLYAGLALTSRGVRVVEFNARFGDPECQVLMMRLAGDIVPYLLACARGDVSGLAAPTFKPQTVICVVMAAKGYPDSPLEGSIIRGADQDFGPHVQVFHAGTRRRDDGQLCAAGGRVLNVCAEGDDIAQARERAYEAIRRIDWPGGFNRLDIGWRALDRG
jgi:phosphoribosylamine--glycine ligase